MRRIRGHVPRSLAGRKPEGSISRRLEIVQRESVFRWSLAVADVVAAIVALQACVLLADERLTPLGLLALPLALVVGQVQRLYSRDELLVNKTTLDQAPQLFQAATLYTLLVLLLEPVFIDGTLQGREVLVLWGTLMLAALIMRRLARGAARRITSAERCLFVGSDELGACR